MNVLNVLLNTQSLLDTHRTGIPQYTWHLFNEMLNHDEIDQLFSFNGKRVRKHTSTRQSNNPTYSDVMRYVLERIPLLKRRTPYYSFKNFNSFAQKSLTQNVIYHEPNFIVKPFDGISVTTLHDLTCLRYPMLQPAATVKWFEKGLTSTLNQVKHIISVSEFTRNEAINYLGINPNRITTVYNGVSSDFRPREEESTRNILKKYYLKYKQYCLTVSTLEPRKNLQHLLEAYLSLPSAIRQRFPLILAGAVGWKIQDIIKKIRKSTGVRMLGYVPQADLPYIFSGAKVFSYLSTYEGFGLPALEALASGVPVITSANSAMAEFSRDNALLVDPYDIDAITTGFRKSIDDDFLSDHAYNMADYYRKHFSWEKCVTKTLALYKQQLAQTSL